VSTGGSVPCAQGVMFENVRYLALRLRFVLLGIACEQGRRGMQTGARGGAEFFLNDKA
tara:strand:+ start:287 stop:460 length:174 start_codon:yes stop_codon:yes gene_type:complete